ERQREPALSRGRDHLLLAHAWPRGGEVPVRGLRRASLRRAHVPQIDRAGQRTGQLRAAFLRFRDSAAGQLQGRVDGTRRLARTQAITAVSASSSRECDAAKVASRGFYYITRHF